MAKSVQEDIRKSRYEKKKILRHEGKEEVCSTDKCVEVKRKLKKTEAEDKIEE
ncbi:MAG: hypothetical protein JW778_06025 [Candidatus Altiarchaeota archaeon]|nr:hypothetical protein [Candidatus Altiarchaeota archaeon]